MFYTGHLAFVAKCNLSQFASNRNNTVRMWVKRQQYTSIIILVVYLSLQIMLCCVHLKRDIAVYRSAVLGSDSIVLQNSTFCASSNYIIIQVAKQEVRVSSNQSNHFYTIMHVFQLFFELSNQDAASFFVSMTSEFVITEKCITSLHMNNNSNNPSNTINIDGRI